MVRKRSKSNVRKCSHCYHEYNVVRHDMTCPVCCHKRRGPRPGAANSGRPKSKISEEVRNADVVWVRLGRQQAERLQVMMEKTELDKAKLGRLGLALIDKLRGRKRADNYLRETLGDELYQATIK